MQAGNASSKVGIWLLGERVDQQVEDIFVEDQAPSIAFGVEQGLSHLVGGEGLALSLEGTLGFVEGRVLRADFEVGLLENVFGPFDIGA